MATEFITTLRDGTGDFSLMSSWESSVQCDLTAATTKVFSHGGITGSIANNDTVTGQTSGATGSVVGVVTGTQILLDGITGTFQSGEVAQVSAGNSVTLSDAGDSPIAVLECYNDWASGLSDNVTISGWTTGASNTIIIRAASGEAHGGVLGGGFWMNKSVNFGKIIASDFVDYLVIRDIEVKNTSSNGQGIDFGSRRVTCERVISSAGAVCFNTVTANGILRNCLAIGLETDVNCFLINSFGTPVIQNCTSIGGSRGFYRANGTAGPTITNCVSYDAATADFDITTTDTTVTYCASGDTSAFGTGAVTGITTADFNDYANDDFSPASGSDLIDAGTDLSGTFTDDIAGNTRG